MAIPIKTSWSSGRERSYLRAVGISSLTEMKIIMPATRPEDPNALGDMSGC